MSKISEHIWRKAEANMAMRERRRLLKLGRIRPTSLPIVMVTNEAGKWVLPRI